MPGSNPARAVEVAPILNSPTTPLLTVTVVSSRASRSRFRSQSRMAMPNSVGATVRPVRMTSRLPISRFQRPQLLGHSGRDQIQPMGRLGDRSHRLHGKICAPATFVCSDTATYAGMTTMVPHSGPAIRSTRRIKEFTFLANAVMRSAN